MLKLCPRTEAFGCLLTTGTHSKNLGHLSNIYVEFLPPDMTLVVQPMDKGVIKILKHHFRKRIDGRTLHLIRINPGAVNIMNFRLSVLGAMHFLSASWNVATPTVITSCLSQLLKKIWFQRNGGQRRGCQH
jgi:hypothetical protein